MKVIIMLYTTSRPVVIMEWLFAPRTGKAKHGKITHDTRGKGTLKQHRDSIDIILRILGIIRGHEEHQQVHDRQRRVKKPWEDERKVEKLAYKLRHYGYSPELIITVWYFYKRVGIKRSTKIANILGVSPYTVRNVKKILRLHGLLDDDVHDIPYLPRRMFRSRREALRSFAASVSSTTPVIPIEILEEGVDSG